jgi:MFS family permease
LKTSERPKNIFFSFSARTFSSLRNPVYRLYFFGMLGQFASMNMQQVTSSLLIYRLTGSSALLGTLSLANAGPMIFLSMFGGALADRMQKKRVLIFGLICSALVALGIGLALMLGILSKDKQGSWWILMLSSFLQGIIMGLMLPARMSIIPEIVSRESAMNAIALNTLGMNVLRFLAPGAAGFLIDAFDFKSIYFTMCGLNVYAAVFILFVPNTSRIKTQTNNIIGDIKEGFKYVLKEKTILLILGFTLVAVILSMPYQQLLPIFVEDILQVGATGMGLLLSLSGAGAMAGSLVLASLPNRKRGLLLLSSGLVLGIALVCFSFSTIWILSLVFMVFLGIGQTIRATLSSALLQSYVEGPYMGRVMSILNVEWGIVSLVTFIAGIMAEFMPVQWVVSSLALLLLFMTFLALIFSPRLRRLE